MDAPKCQQEEFLQSLVKNQRRIFGFIHAMIPNLSDAEEVLQETCLVLWRKWDSFDSDREFLPWSLGIARLEVLKRLSRRRREGVVGLREDLAEEIARLLIERTENLDNEQLRLDALKTCLEKLRDSDRELIERRYREKTTIRKVAHALERPESTVYQALARIRQQLFDCIQRRLAAEEREI